jgi:hypothetical protein
MKTIALRRSVVVMAAVLAATLAGCASASVPARTSAPVAAASVGPSVPSVASSAAAASTSPGGGKLAEALVATLQADPFVAHVEESILASSTTGATRITLTAKAVGDISGADMALHTSGTGGGPATDQEIVSVGDAAWVRAKGAPTWDVHPRTDVATALDGLLHTVRLLDDPTQLVDSGVETLDGKSVHHLTAPGFVKYQSPSGLDGSYDTFDIWATDNGIPVLVKASFSAAEGINSITGSTEIRYSKVGGPITITPPAGAPTLAP